MPSVLAPDRGHALGPSGPRPVLTVALPAEAAVMAVFATTRRAGALIAARITVPLP